MRQRLLAFLLLTIFLGAGTTVPGPDALFHHLNGHADQLRTHLDPAGGCSGHAEKCTLGRAATGAGAAIAHAPVLSTQAAEVPPPAVAAAVGIVLADLAALPHSRAPPAHVV
jgi:hypothetical protein